jgi:ABC-type multidrug transport system ATPase subunit
MGEAPQRPPNISIQLQGVTFGYSRHLAVLNELSLELDNKATVVLGPNGAGKSTLLRVLAGRLRPRSGLMSGAIRVGFSPQFTPLLPGFTVKEQVRYAAWLAGLPRRAAEDQAIRSLRMTRLEDLQTRLAQRLSGGERARLGIACALAGLPDYLILDEPSASLDPIARESVREILGRLSAKGIGLLASSHTAADLQDPFQRVLVMGKGKILFDGPVGKFLEESDNHSGMVADLARAIRGARG